MEIIKFGVDHPSLLTSIDSLGNVLKKEKRYSEAEKTYREVLDRTRVLGVANPYTSDSAYGLACVLALEGKLDDAITDLQFAVDHALSTDERRGWQTIPKSPRYMLTRALLQL